MKILKSLQARVEPIICHKEDVGPKDNEERGTVQISCEYSRTNSDSRTDKKDSSFVKYMFCKALHIFKDKIGEPVEECPKQNFLRTRVACYGHLLVMEAKELKTLHCMRRCSSNMTKDIKQ